MKIAHISDWHGTHGWAKQYLAQQKAYDEDVELVLITGDMLRNYNVRLKGIHAEFERHRQRKEWELMFPALRDTWPNAEFVAVPGNHDWCDYGIMDEVKSFDAFEPHFLKLRGLNIAGFRGVPYFNGFWHGEMGDHYFYHCMEGLDTCADIILTHSPPYGVLDEVTETRRIGIMNFEEWFIQHPWARRRIHAFGHVHEEGGLRLERNGVLFSNASGGINLLTL